MKNNNKYKDSSIKKIWKKPVIKTLDFKHTKGGGGVGTEVLTFDPVS